MIHYQLRCDGGHAFDGWFKDSAGFDKLARAGMVECPVCGGTQVQRALMAPAIAKGRADPVPDVPPAPPPAAAPAPGQVPAHGQAAAAGPLPAQMIALLQRMRAEVEKNCDYVGSDFAEEARRMHAGESERRGIYGEASDTEAEELRDDGIEIARIPWLPRADG
ncbi:DUF1178 family protein [Roseomonas sp. OT10]|uniref:DUF1178 family protein n=1 Tax=Roseomonas cutis TaxID=2897332 RepID=UPI001E574D2E|nr:DUF1178 family protein [Roseomonas sp. OT10]UFN47301.1 DUF1178 family protein [Roseomonas sp. OT10]